MTHETRSQDQRPFHVDVRPQRDHVVVVPVGELDIVTAPELEQQLRELEEAGFASIVLDLSALEFLDSSGIRLIVARDQLARSNGHDFTLIEGSATIQRTLRLAGVADLLRFRANR
jgi:anti-sigma B factor antagonist